MSDDAPLSDDRRAFNHQFADVNGIRMHFVVEGDGPLVVLLHGYPFLWYLWRHRIKTLAAAGYRVAAPDQRGYGQTESPRDVDSYDITHLVGDVVAVINSLGASNAVLIGQDWGSPVAYNVALMRPDLVRGVLMMCSPPAARGKTRPSEAMKRVYGDLIFYQSFMARPEAEAEVMRDVRRFLLFIRRPNIVRSTNNGAPRGKLPRHCRIRIPFRRHSRRI